MKQGTKVITSLSLGILSVFLLAVVACSGTSSDSNSQAGTADAVPTAVPETVTEISSEPQTAKDKAVAIIATEPEVLFFMLTADAHSTQFSDTTQAYMGHLDKNTLEVAPTSLLMGWEQTAPDEWVYQLRPGVKFHDGENWNSEAWEVYAKIAGTSEFGQGSFAHTGPYHIEPVDDLTAKVKCHEPCPLFPRGLNLSPTLSPSLIRDVKSSSDLQQITEGPGAGPFKVKQYDRGQRILTEKFEGFVPAPETPEYAAPILSEIEWQWRQETVVRAAMIETGEADWAFLLTLEDAETLGPEQYVTGGTAEIAQFRFDTIWDPWLKVKEMRQAIIHSIDCEEIVETLYQLSLIHI